MIPVIVVDLRHWPEDLSKDVSPSHFGPVGSYMRLRATGDPSA